ncbi:MAG: 6-bladed beta-propeller [Tannerellaceae bacterium]|nr:6-bladed beta-propeller [Tannerellaceae bacterium]
MLRTMSKIFIISFAALLMGGCRQAADLRNETATVPFSRGVETVNELRLSHIAASVEYVPLETTDLSLLSRIRSNMRATQQYIFIHAGGGLFQFSRSGRFLRQIGRHGQGPGEYSSLMHYAIDEPNEKIYLLSSPQVLCYDMDGNWLNNFRIDKDLAWQIALVNDTTLAAYIYDVDGSEEHSVVLYNTKGERLNAFPPVVHIPPGSNGGMNIRYDDRFMFTYDGQACFKDECSDTLFVVTPQELKPRYAFEMGKYRLPMENHFAVNGQLFDQTKSNYLHILPIETRDYFFIPYTTWGVTDGRLCVYDKGSAACFTVSGNGIVNDMDDGLPFTPLTSIGDNTLVSVWEASEVIRLMGEHPSLGGIEVFRQLLEDDNPVLMIVDLK